MSPRKKDDMAGFDNERIFELLQSLDTKVSDVQKSLGDALSRVASLETSDRTSEVERQRFWNQTWPAEQKVVSMMEERVRALEQERATSEKVDKLESRFVEGVKKLDEKMSTLASKGNVEKIDARLTAVEKDEAQTSTKFKYTLGVAAFICGAILSAVVQALMKKFVG